jgi:phosphotransferase system enzyme I (PtsI)
MRLIDDGSSADAAILRATDEQADTLAAVDDEYFRERAADVRDVGRRVASMLVGGQRPDLWHRDG